MKTIKALCLSMMTCFLLAACGNVAANDNTTLRLAVNDASTTLNFLSTILEPNITLIMNLQEGLVQYNDNAELVPMSASAWNVSDDGMTYTFTLREDAKWENGDAVSAADFVYSVHTRIQDPEAVYSDYYKVLMNGEAVLNGSLPVSELGIKALDEMTLEFTLAEPMAGFLDLLAFETFLPLNQKFYEQVGAAGYGTSADTILANGAYTITDYNGASGWTLRKNEQYWNAAQTALETVDVRVVKEISTAELMWQNGELDILDLSADIMDNYKSDPQLKSQLKAQMNYFYLSNATGQNPLLGNKNFRAAIAHSINKELLTSNILKDGSVAADYFVAEAVLFQNGKDFRATTDAFATPLFDVAKAQAYLAAAKQELATEQLTFNLEIYDLGKTQSIYENIKAQIEQNLPGVTVQLISNPTQTYFQKLYEYHTPAAASQWQPDYLDIANYFLPFQSDASQNFAQWKNEAYDNLYRTGESAALASEPLQRWVTYAEAEKVLIEDYTIIPIYQSGASYLQRDNVEGYILSPGLPSVLYKNIRKV